MHAALNENGQPRPAPRLLITAIGPLLPQILGSIFNIWYNMAIIRPLLAALGLTHRFIQTAIWWNAIAYPIAVGIWLWLILSLRGPANQLIHGETIPAEKLDRLRRCIVHLPWSGAVISGVGWLLGAVVFLISLSLAAHPLSTQLFWHLPISFAVSGFIAMTQSFFLIEWTSQWSLFPIFFQNIRPDRLKGIHPISLRTRGLMWTISIGICPIGSLLLLMFAPTSAETTPQGLALFVGGVSIAFGLCSALLIGHSISQPLEQLGTAANAVTEGRLDLQVPVRRADEFGALIGEFNRMISGLREREKLRLTFGLHVGRKAAEQILARDPSVGGSEQEITVMFVDIRSFTARSAHLKPDKVVALLNEFLQAMVEVIEGEHGGMINKFLGDGFMALFGVGSDAHNHADRALAAGRELQRRLERLNLERARRTEDAIQIGIGINTGPVIVGSIGSSERMEFTVIGNTVNVASRIEGLNKPLGTNLLISKATRDSLHRTVQLKTLPPQPVKGVDQPVEIFTLAD